MSLPRIRANAVSLDRSMDLGTRIVERLGALGMSQAELARRATIPQSTINSLIKRGRRSSPHLVRIARELRTTPAYLTGESDDPESEFPEDDVNLSSEERELIELFRALSPAERSAAALLLRSIATSARSPGIHG